MSRLKWTLDTLPRELLVNICEILYYDDRAPSLASFSAVNKTCRDAAIGILVRNIDFILDDDEFPGVWHSLHLNTLSCELMLRKNDLLSQVRQISIWGEPPTPGKDYANGPYLTENRYDSRQSGWKQGRMFAAEVAEDDARKMDDCNLVGARDYLEGYANCQWTYDSSSAWSPMARLIKELSNLSDILFTCPTQFPPSLFATLKQYHPRCRIHLPTFNLLSLRDSRPDEYELELVHSPNLYSIDCSHFHLYPAVNQLNTTVMRMLTRTAPGLQEVRVAYDSIQDSPYELHEISWSGAKGLDSCFPQHRKSLRTFHLTWDPQLSDYSLLCKWGRFIDFDALRILRLPEPLGPQGLELLDTYSFPFLKNLVLNIFNLSSMNDPEYERERLITQFIDRRTKLWTLEVIGWNSFHLGKLFSPSCSFALRTLDLQSNRYTTDPFNAQVIALIAQRWPLIEDLAIRVRRSRGDEEEMATYVALGKLRRLRNLSLRLMPMQRGWQFPQDRRTLSLSATVAPGEVIGDAAVDRLNPNYREEYRDLLINVAVDETLACEIFHAISTEGGTFQHQNLEKLELRVDDWSWAGQLQGKGQEVKAFCSILGRPWNVRRDHRFDHRSEVSALLVGDKFNTWRATAGTVPGLVEGLLHEVFREIWPRAEGSGPEARHSWQTDWKSFPLSAYGHRS
ncbi:hypothetical protein CPAR01_04707 [Colletotrichum paranaense]|uniref:F-box domain-containing protein n=1 Tax=Colletotrichum paranaense TaxID=1914294 RepID=A0ABQ9SXT2_9PEZI|nr:uncharacterized protein CPAR01_04707 [Colletotrichum paranaense]KAK1544074.1 hypothetical protein CPAR01_04707 [Colletotrichum paranaense]